MNFKLKLNSTLFALITTLSISFSANVSAITTAVVTILDVVGGTVKNDFNGDGKSDIVLRQTASGKIFVWLLNGTSLTTAGYVANPGTDIEIVGLADSNGDGKSDIVLRQTASGKIFVWLINGTSLTAAGFVANPGTDIDYINK